MRRVSRLALVPIVSLLLGTFVLTAPAGATEGDCGAGTPFTDTASGRLVGPYDRDWWTTTSKGNVIVTIDVDTDQSAIMVDDHTCNNSFCLETGMTHYTCRVLNYQGQLNVEVQTMEWPNGISVDYTIHIDQNIGVPSVPAQCGDGVDNDLDGATDYPADPGCTSADDSDESSPAPPSTCNVVNTAGVCVDVRTGDVVTQQTVYGVVTTTTTTRSVAGYLDAYRFTLPTGGSATVPCVTLVALSTVNPCQTAGGTFVSRTATLVDQTVNQPGVGTGPALATVRVCEALVTITVGGFGVNDFPALYLC